LNLPDDKVKELISIKIPLLEKDRIRIQNCIATISCEDAPQNESVRGAFQQYPLQKQGFISIHFSASTRALT
jgi:hypothetical protein